ncbi:cytochrome b561 [Citrobacter freundii]|nr:cytochrome b561 [Citrobacter freundii]
MNRFSKIQIRLHWLTLMLIAITYAAMELRGWFPKGSTPYLLMKETHYNAGVFVWFLMIIRLIIKHKYHDPAITPTPPCMANVVSKDNAYHALHFFFGTPVIRCRNHGLWWKGLESPGF